jgi:hypothetical protein
VRRAQPSPSSTSVLRKPAGLARAGLEPPLDAYAATFICLDEFAHFFDIEEGGPAVAAKGLGGRPAYGGAVRSALPHRADLDADGVGREVRRALAQDVEAFGLPPGPREMLLILPGYNGSLPTAVLVREGGENMTHSRKMFWIGGALIALAVVIVVLVVAYSGGGSGGGY